MREELIIKGTQAKEASNVIAQASATEKNKALSEMAQALVDNMKAIIEATSANHPMINSAYQNYAKIIIFS